MRNGDDSQRYVPKVKQTEIEMQREIDKLRKKVERLERTCDKQLDQLKTFILNVQSIPGINLAELNLTHRSRG